MTNAQWIPRAVMLFEKATNATTQPTTHVYPFVVLRPGPSH